MRKFALAVGVATLVTAGPAWADLTKCQAGIEKNGSKLQAAILKAFTKCADGFRKANGVPATVMTAAASCQGGLTKALDFGNNILLSAMEKTKASLDKLTTFIPPASPTCSADDLGRLGHLRSDLFGDRWARLTLLSGLKGAYDTQAALQGDFPNTMIELEKTGACPLCGDLATPPCLTSACVLNTGSPNVETKFASPAAVPLPLTLSGVTITTGCEWQNVLPNEIGFLGNANIGLKPTTIIGNTICNINFRAEGVYSCTGSGAPRVSYTSCQDSMRTDAGGDECVAGATTCAPNPDDLDPTNPAGGVCTTFTTAASAQGDAFVATTTRLRVSQAVGGDGVACTRDDTYTPTAPGIIAVTTGSATASVMDWNNTDGQTESEGPEFGVLGPSCASIRSGVSTNFRLAGAFPAADVNNMPYTGLPGSPLGDTVTKLKLTCN